MQRVSPLWNSNGPEERRQHVRRGLTSSILYVELGSGNGGIVVSLGTGGLSLHAAIKLNADEELALRFQLDPAGKAIETAGRVVWLGPTRKEAGISFKDLPADAERQIANWIAAQEQPVSVTQSDVAPQPASPPIRAAAPPISIQAPAPASLVAERSGNAPSSLGLGIPRRIVSEPSHPDELSNTPSGVQPATSLSAALPFPTPEKRYEKPSDKLLLRAPVKRYEVLLEPEKPAPAAKEIVPKETRLTTLVPSSANVIEVPAPQATDSAAPKLRPRRKLAMVVAACAVGVVVLMVTLMSASKPSEPSGPDGESVESIPQAAAVEPGRAPQTAPEAAADQSAPTEPFYDASPEAYYDLLPILPTHLPASVPRNGDWGAHVEAMFGFDVPMKVNPGVLSLPVWTVQHSGYYYCFDNLNSETPLQGALMFQGDALQSGYQPKLGNYCN